MFSFVFWQGHTSFSPHISFGLRHAGTTSFSPQISSGLRHAGSTSGADDALEPEIRHQALLPDSEEEKLVGGGGDEVVNPNCGRYDEVS